MDALSDQKVPLLHWAVSSGKVEIVKQLVKSMSQKQLQKSLHYTIKEPVLLCEIGVGDQESRHLHSIEWRRDGGTLWTANSGRVKIINVQEKNVIDQEWSPDSSKLCIQVSISDVEIWDAVQNEVIGRIVKRGRIDQLQWNLDGSRLALASDNSYQIWDMGGTLLDWVVRAVYSGADIALLEVVINEYSAIEGYCSNTLLLKLCTEVTVVRHSEPIRYENLLKMIQLITEKPGAPV